MTGAAPIEPGSLPLEVRELFARLEAPSEHDLLVLARQLGRGPLGCIFVAARCPHGRPAVLLTVPFEADGGPVPPTLWLTCPFVSREMARLEGGGFMRGFVGRLDVDDVEAARFAEEEKRFGEAQAAMAREKAALAARLRDRGVAGGRRGLVKCLHAHLAFRLAAGRGVVGGWCVEELEERTGCWCERIPEACLT